MSAQHLHVWLKKNGNKNESVAFLFNVQKDAKQLQRHSQLPQHDANKKPLKQSQIMCKMTTKWCDEIQKEDKDTKKNQHWPKNTD